MKSRLSIAQTRRDARRTAATAPRSSDTRAAGAPRRKSPAGPAALPQGQRRSTRPLDGLAEAGYSLLWRNRLVLHVLCDHVDHRCGQTVFLRHVVREAEDGLIIGDGVFQSRSSPPLTIRPAGTG